MILFSGFCDEQKVIEKVLILMTPNVTFEQYMYIKKAQI